MDALIVGGTRFIGRHATLEFAEAGYDVTLFNRGDHPNPFADDDRVEHVEGDRTDDDALQAAAGRVEPDVVVDCVAYHPGEVRAATEIFDDVDAYVYISSGAAYEPGEIPTREGETPLRECTADEATDDSPETYGARKAAGDRAAFEAAGRGVNAMVVRPCFVYGPYDYTERFDYWIDRVATHDRIVVPGDGDHIAHRVYVEDAASALRVVAEEGEPGEAYNVGDRRLLALDGTVEALADALGTDVDPVHASERELAEFGLGFADFPLRLPSSYVMDTAKLAALGWESTPVAEALSRTAEEHLESDRTGRENGPDREAEERAIGALG